ncbi:MAG: hypothetical protein AAB734_03480 [Patescibacteria group bacterium]
MKKPYHAHGITQWIRVNTQVRRLQILLVDPVVMIKVGQNNEASLNFVEKHKRSLDMNTMVVSK